MPGETLYRIKTRKSRKERDTQKTWAYKKRQIPKKETNTEKETVRYITEA